MDPMRTIEDLLAYLRQLIGVFGIDIKGRPRMEPGLDGAGKMALRIGAEFRFVLIVRDRGSALFGRVFEGVVTVRPEMLERPRDLVVYVDAHAKRFVLEVMSDCREMRRSPDEISAAIGTQLMQRRCDAIIRDLMYPPAAEDPDFVPPVEVKVEGNP